MKCGPKFGHSRVWIAAVFSVASVLQPASGWAQRGDVFNAAGATTSLTAGYENQNGGGTILLLQVYSENEYRRMDRQCVVKLTNETTHEVNWQSTTPQSDASFAGMAFGHYEIEVSGVGYITAHKELTVISSLNTIREQIVLQRDPAAVQLAYAEAALPAHARKDTKRGVMALKSGNLKQAQRWLDAAYQAAPGNADLNFLKGYLSYQENDFEHARLYLGTAASLNQHDAQSLTLLGRLDLKQEDYVSASSVLEKAVAADSEYWMARDLLAGSYLKQRKYEAAREQAELAIAKGREGAGSSQLVLGQALVNLGKKREGLNQLKNYVRDSPKSPATPQVKSLIAELEASDSATQLAAGAEVSSAPLTGIDPLLASPEMSFSVKPWQPVGIDDARPAVAAGVTCPADRVMQMSGERVREFVSDVSRISAIEHLEHERVDETGNAIDKETRDFNYVAAFSEDQPGMVGVEEYRAEHLGIADFPDQISSSGFAALALVFHPQMRDGFEMTCEGLGDLHGKAVWLVHFRQRDDRPARIHDYRVGAETYAVRLKGRAWITADRFQILRIESELIRPLKPIQLVSERQVVEYGPVPFPKRDVELWLPRTAEIYFEFRRRRYYRRHSFDHYMLFAVASDEKRKEPKALPDANIQPAPN
jgi:hypothetical protein